ncbi:hypothetical protein C8A00DRAFT_32501 [Chaetomidium leptoderma]|uniref:Uncharacterized protein n=1 Tax=Chaetomidium leptoderma TaxID=669021 RepID=A0AAN6VQT7_9PEZI|nr:hypothetical protein C8A00DRAFT_32501 [Chaetomidium leptoderma]
MGKCPNKCGKDTTETAGFVVKSVSCGSCPNNQGWSRCGGCTRGPRDIVLKCCGRCSPAGKIECLICKGKGTRKVNEVCRGTHKKK